VKDGQQVKKGDLIFRLDPSTLTNEIAQAEAAIKKQQLETQLAKYQSALGEEDQALPSTEAEMKKKFVEKETTKLQQELNNVTVDIQRKEIAQKQKKVDASEYIAPSPGIFLYDDPNKIPKALKENDRVGKIVDLKKLQLVTLVGEQDVFRIKPGMAVEVKMNAMKNVKLQGKVLKVSKFAKAVSEEQSNNNQPAQFEVIIGLDANENLIAGLSLTGQIETQRKENAIVVPTVAVMREKDSVYVMLDKGNGQVERKDIKVGLETSEKTEVLEGLKEGDTVVLQ
ncbi:MAG: efflux RND transporter periplasmic adaptor subunit, partial [Bacillus sp. (in: firmicutes)]